MRPGHSVAYVRIAEQKTDAHEMNKNTPGYKRDVVSITQDETLRRIHTWIHSESGCKRDDGASRHTRAEGCIASHDGGWCCR